MVDLLKVETKEHRSFVMSRVRSKNTKPEIIVRKLICRLGYRYRLNDARFPGRPDLSFSKRKKVIFVHGCFWHGHDCPAGRNVPKSNLVFWNSKFKRNEERDLENQVKLKKLGLRFLVIWECETKNSSWLTDKIIDFLDS